MNIPVLIAASITSLAFVAHTFVGTKESYPLRPSDTTTPEYQHWMQSMAAFQMITVDLLILSIILWLISLTNWLPLEHEIILLLSGCFFVGNNSLVHTIVFLTKKKKDFWILSPWLFVC